MFLPYSSAVAQSKELEYKSSLSEYESLCVLGFPL